MTTPFDPVTNIADAPVEGGDQKSPWNGQWQVLTPQMRDAGGRLGLVMNRLARGSVGCPFHWHTHEDEVFYVVSGRGVLRYGEERREIGLCLYFGFFLCLIRTTERLQKSTVRCGDILAA